MFYLEWALFVWIRILVSLKPSSWYITYTHTKDISFWLRLHVKTTTLWNSLANLNSLHTIWAFRGTSQKSDQAQILSVRSLRSTSFSIQQKADNFYSDNNTYWQNVRKKCTFFITQLSSMLYYKSLPGLY